MKKIVLSLAGVLAATAFAPEASALPAFARQTGMACQACHFQKFPVLNGFGRAFKAAGYTMMGAQGKVEGEHLSIPDTLNAAILAKVRYQKDNTAKKATATAANGLGDGQLQFGDELSLFFGGRVAENIGFLFEGNTVNNAAAGGTGNLLAGFKLPVMFDVGSAKLGLVPFTTDALGPQYGFELSSGGVLRANRWSELRREASAVQYNADRGADAGAATGFAFVAQNDMGYINVTKYAPSFGMGSNGGTTPSYDMKSTYVRIAATPTVGDWAMVVGAGNMSGTSLTGAAGAPAVATLIQTKQTFFDFQAHGELGGKEIGFYAQHASAPATINTNAYNTGVTTRKAWTLGADYSVIPHTLAIGAAYRNAQNGAAAGANGDNAFMVTAVYDLVQNIALHLNYATYSGSAHNAVGSQKNQYLLMLEGAF
ncbi:MAG TPA: hypothetical protein VFP33_05555 [Gallionella sp.]|nr:hypothetical protein [Gallionella sp.]